MGASSHLKHYVRFSESLFGADDAFDTGYSQRLINNVNHLADQAAQTRVSWSLPSTQSAYGWPSDVGTPVVDTWYLLWASNPMDFHVRVNAGARETYRMRCRVRGQSDSGTNQVTFRAVLAWAGAETTERDIAGVNVDDASATSSSDSWLLMGDLLYLDAQRIDVARRKVNSPDAVGGNVSLADMIRCRLMVWGRADVDAAASEPLLSGVELSEYLT